MMFGQWPKSHRIFKRLYSDQRRLICADQHRLICAFAGHKYHIVGNLMSRLTCCGSQLSYRGIIGKCPYIHNWSFWYNLFVKLSPYNSGGITSRSAVFAKIKTIYR